MNLDEYRKQFPDQESAPGWDAIDERLATLYGNAKPSHYAPEVLPQLGGEDPLNGISIYKVGNGKDLHYHLVTYGFSVLFYDEESAGGEYSGCGFELTFRVKPQAADEGEPLWAVNMLQNLAKYVFGKQTGFDDHQWIGTGPLRVNSGTKIVGLAFITDPELGVIDSPHGEVKFLQAVGITDRELAALKAKETKAQPILAALMEGNPLLVTDLSRT